MNTGLFANGSLRLGWTGLRGKAGLGPTLLITGDIVARGYRVGAVVLITAEVTATQLAKGNNAYIGSTVPQPFVLAYVKQQWVMPNPPPPDETAMGIEVQLHLDASTLEALEDRRQGKDFYLQIDTTVLLVDRGTPDESGAAEHLAVHYQVHPTLQWQDQLQVTQHLWGHVLQQWERGVGIPLVLPLPEVSPDARRSEVVRCVRDAWQKVDGADFPGSIAASRKALELLRDISPSTQPLPAAAKDRDVDQRVRAVLDALFSLASAPAHVDGPTKNFQPQRGDAVAVVAATAAIAQQIFAQLKTG